MSDRIHKALADLEICANTVDSCYTRNPGNFAAALRDLRESAERARAALDEGAGSIPPLGWKLVPIEPTPEMIEAGERCTDSYYSNDDDFTRGWRAAVEAAPVANEGPAEPTENKGTK